MIDILLEWAKGVVAEHGLPGLFVVMVIGSSPIPIPVEILALLAVSLGASPFYIALFSSIGATIGGLVSYYVGKGIMDLTGLKERQRGNVERAKDWLDNYGAPAVLLFALVPLPYDAIALVAGGARMKRRKFVTATFLGRALRYAFLAYAGSEALKFFL